MARRQCWTLSNQISLSRNGPSENIVVWSVALSFEFNSRSEQNGRSFHSYLKATRIQCNGLLASPDQHVQWQAYMQQDVQARLCPIKCIHGHSLSDWKYTPAPGVKTFSGSSASAALWCSFSCLGHICVTSILSGSTMWLWKILVLNVMETFYGQMGEKEVTSVGNSSKWQVGEWPFME